MTRTKKSLVGASAIALFALLAALAFSPRAYATEKQNELTDEQYAAFGLSLEDPDLFADESDPLKDYVPTVLSELYVGSMNATGQSHYEGSFRVLDETDELSAEALNVKAATRTLVGSQTSLSNYDSGFQTQNTCAVDVDGDGQDEIAELALYTKNKSDKSSRQDLAVLSYYRLDGNTWKKTQLTTWSLTDAGSTYIQDIDANMSKSYVAICAGNFDNSADGTQEIACYIPARTGKGAFVSVYSPSEKAEKFAIDLSNIDSRFDVTSSAWTLTGTNMPVVGLSATSISGQDDLVVNVSNPLKSGVDQRAALIIYRLDGGLPTQLFSDHKMTSSADHRMRFCSAVDADLLGNGERELVVGGYENYDFSNDTTAGKLSAKNNMIQFIAWDSASGAYCKVWGNPQDTEIAYGSKLATGTAMMEPAAMAAGRLRTASLGESVFLEGVVLRFKTQVSTTASTLEMLQSGSFLAEFKIATNGGNSAFISQAAIGHFSTANPTCEQLVVLQGDENTFNGINDKVYYDISWTWENNGQLTSSVTNNDYVESDQDDNGTYMSICALNADKDTIQVKYQGRSMGWSEPELYCVLMSPPYWRELQYEDGLGSVSFEISTGHMDGRDWDLNIGGGVYCHIQATFGAGFMGTNGRAGAAAEASVMAQLVHEHSYASTSSTSYRVTVSPGEDHVVVYAIPVVTYLYRVYVPEYEITEEGLAIYNEYKAASDPVYNVGDIVPGEWQDVSYTVEGNACISHMTLDRYNELVAEMGDAVHLTQITPDMLPSKTIGDPSTYPKDKTDLTQRGNVRDLEISKNAASVAAGDGETELIYTVGYENEDATGFNVDAEYALAFAGEATIDFVVSAHAEVELGGKFTVSGGTVWTGSNTHDWSFSTCYADLPEGTGTAYNYSSNMAVYTLDLPGTNDDPYCIAYTVSTAAADALPPVLPAQLRVFATTDHEVVLRWERGDTARAAESWEVFVVDNNGLAQSLGVVDEPAFVATHLDAATTYSFALVAYTGPGGTGVASSRSAFVSATTKEEAGVAPWFSERPVNTSVILGSDEDKALSARAEMGEGMAEKGAVLSYQWQRLESDNVSVAGTWENIPGATGETLALPKLSLDEGGTFVGDDGEAYGRYTYYRVVATQRLGANVHSVISRSACMIACEVDPFEGPSPAGAPVATLGAVEGPEDVHVLGQGRFCFYDVEGTGVSFVATLMDGEDNEAVPVAGATVRLMGVGFELDDELSPEPSAEAFVIAEGTTDENGTVAFDVAPELLPAKCAVYLAFEGAVDENGEQLLLPAQSNVLWTFAVRHQRVAYNVGDGGNDARNPQVLTNMGDGFALYPATRRGFTFVGWFDENDSLVESLAAATLGGTATRTLTAAFEPIYYPITYMLDGGVNAEGNPDSYCLDGSATLLPATKAGFVFAGWYLDEAHTQQVTSIPLGAEGPIVFFAAWEPTPVPEPADDPGVDPSDDPEVKPDDGPTQDDVSPTADPSKDSTQKGGKQSNATTGGTPATGDVTSQAMAFMAFGGLLAVALSRKLKRCAI